MKFPYGIADFHQVVTEAYCYVDRTAQLARREDAGKQLIRSVLIRSLRHIRRLLGRQFESVLRVFFV